MANQDDKREKGDTMKRLKEKWIKASKRRTVKDYYKLTPNRRWSGRSASSGLGQYLRH